MPKSWRLQPWITLTAQTVAAADSPTILLMTWVGGVSSTKIFGPVTKLLAADTFPP
jgi:hypothetical protein